MPEKGKESNKQTIRQLPDRYPRTEEILIFWDMSELDRLFDSLDRVKENAKSVAPNVTSDEWNELFNFSGVYGLIVFLRKACFEYERFWIDEEDWNLEDDEEFNEYMNDPDELQWLVTELDFGRVKPVDGKNTRFYEPAYLAAARSLQLAMYTYKYVGDHEWVSYCINELKQTLTRYHAAALEIALHRENIYLNENKEYFSSIDGMRAGNKNRVREQQENAIANHAEIRRQFNQLSKDKPHMSKTARVKKLIEMTGVGERTIWRALESNPEAQE